MAEPLLEAHPSSRPYLPGSNHCPHLYNDVSHQDQLGLGGFVSNAPEHFMVHELPKYMPSGDGEHTMVLILKYMLSTEEAISKIASATGVMSSDIGYSGRKDKYAIATQWLSLPCLPEQVKSGDPNVFILQAVAHKNKLRLGHNAGNLFNILISDIRNPERVEDELERLKKGIPNYFGTQRFGRPFYEKKPTEGYQPPISPNGVILQDPLNPARDNVDRALIFLDRFHQKKNQRVNGKKKREIKLALSALQSALFNLWIGQRLHDGLIDQVIMGDVCRKVEGGTFYSTDPELDTARLVNGEIDILGPMVGPKLFPAQAEAREREEALYQSWGLTEARRNGLGKIWRGDRRPIKLRPQHLQGALESQLDETFDLRLRFSLPSGSFATNLLGALISPESQVFLRVRLD